ncbi:sugar phosphate isomerase/epimerase [Horticoccus luteus]|uniref:Sugar phosphate isomerase/epimerase n=1 Tax=Horticoccus luteus TaxID=2862869 RepID=A0A8F9XHE9_9BACT|nr:sugar phosphate isomerase/epimerase [Horticoccus luteus]QYM79255.1 sugar phosphate isomerase/epimerase [Horticoccus luteus]
MKPTPAPTTPRLIQCASTWSMIGLPSAKREWSLERKFAAIKEAGFDGVATLASPEVRRLADQFGLLVMGGFDCGNVRRAREQLQLNLDLGVELLNVQLLNHDTPPATAAALAVKVVELGAALGLRPHIETHRDTATETPEKFDEIARLFRRATGRLMPVTWDHSHFAVSKHVQPADYSRRLLVWPKLIQHSQLFHLRPFNSQHCQVPVSNGRGRLTPEFIDYRAFVVDLFALWLAGPKRPAELWVCPELGMSHGYHVSTNPPVWDDVLIARREYASAWREAAQRGASA